MLLPSQSSLVFSWKSFKGPCQARDMFKCLFFILKSYGAMAQPRRVQQHLLSNLSTVAPPFPHLLSGCSFQIAAVKMPSNSDWLTHEGPTAIFQLTGVWTFTGGIHVHDIVRFQEDKGCGLMLSLLPLTVQSLKFSN